MNHPLRKIALVVVLAASVLPLTLPSIAKADPAPTTVRISEKAQFISPMQINLEVTLSCNAGGFFAVSAMVAQPQPALFVPPTTGTGFTSGGCTGQQEKLVVSVFTFFVFPGWQLGDAVASVAACLPCAVDTREIRIVL
jgi:hypothetical protein